MDRGWLGAMLFALMAAAMLVPHGVGRRADVRVGWRGWILWEATWISFA
jgi:hypothetical protein